MARLRPLLLLTLLGLLAPAARAEEPDPEEVARLKAEMATRAGVAPAVQRGVVWLRAQQQKDGALQPDAQAAGKVKLPKGVKRPPQFKGHNGHRFGKTALGALTLAHCGVTPENATLVAALDYLRKEYRGVMRKGYANHGATYSMALLLMALHAYYKLEDAPRNEKADPKRNPLGMPGRDLAIVRAVGDWLIRTRIEGGLWGYPYPPVKRAARARVPQDATGYVPRGDMSNSQYALLGLWTATRCGWRAPREPMVAIAEEVLRWQGSKGPAVRRGLDPAPGGSGASTSVAPLTDRARGFGYGPPMRRGVMVILGLGVPWFAYMAVRYSDVDFLGQYFGHYTFGRVVGNIGERGPLFYPVVLLGDAQPGLAVLPFAAYIAWRRGDRSPAAVLPWVGMAWIVLLFTIPAGKRNVYMMPVYPLLAVATAPLMLAVWEGRNKAGVLLGGCAAAFGCWAGALLLYLLSRNAPLLAPEIHVATGFLVVMGFPLLYAGVRGAGRVLAVSSLGTVFCLLVGMAVLMPGLARYRPIPGFARQVRSLQDARAPEPVLIHAAKIHSMNFYLGRATKVSHDGEDLLRKMGVAERAFVIVQQHDFDAPPRDPGTRRRGLANDGTGLVFEELARQPELIFRFDRSILGRGRTTRDLLLLRATRTGKTWSAMPGDGEDGDAR